MPYRCHICDEKISDHTSCAYSIYEWDQEYATSVGEAGYMYNKEFNSIVDPRAPSAHIDEYGKFIMPLSDTDPNPYLPDPFILYKDWEALKKRHDIKNKQAGLNDKNNNKNDKTSKTTKISHDKNNGKSNKNNNNNNNNHHSRNVNGDNNIEASYASSCVNSHTKPVL